MLGQKIFGLFCYVEFIHRCGNDDAVQLLLRRPDIDVNIVDNKGWSALHHAVIYNNIEGLKLLLSHPSLAALTLNHKDKDYGATPVMLTVLPPSQVVDSRVLYDRLEHLAMLAADPRVDLDTTDREGRSLEESGVW